MMRQLGESLIAIESRIMNTKIKKREMNFLYCKYHKAETNSRKCLTSTSDKIYRSLTIFKDEILKNNTRLQSTRSGYITRFTNSSFVKMTPIVIRRYANSF